MRLYENEVVTGKAKVMENITSQVQVLGASGGIGVAGEGTTCFMIDDDVLIDAGTGMLSLSAKQLAKIDHVFLTHSHMDHICSLPLLMDTVVGQRTKPIKVYGLAPTLKSIKQCIFNDTIWPDFNRIPSAETPTFEYVEIRADQTIDIGKNRKMTSAGVPHSVPGLGYLLSTPTGSWAFSGDTDNPVNLFALMHMEAQMKYLFIEAAFPDEEQWLAELSLHLHPEKLRTMLQTLPPECEIWISHLKPNKREEIKAQLIAEGGPQVNFLASGQQFKI